MVVTILATLAIDKGIAVDVLSHERKCGQAAAGDVNRGRGARAFKDGGRLIYTNTWMTEEEAKGFGVSEEERRPLFRVDSAKVNLAPPSATAQWFRLVSVNLDNGDDLYPAGDEVQTVERWTLPDRLRAGMGDGRLYSVAPSAKERAAWRALQAICPCLSEKRCREVIKAWVKNGTLTIGSYRDPKERREIEGVTAAKTVGGEKP